LALINKQGFQTNLLYNLMILNPQVAKAYWLMDALKQVQPPLTTNHINQIKELATIFSDMEVERTKLWNLILQRDNAYNTIELYYAHDTVLKAKDSLISILEDDPRVNAKYNLVNQYIARNDTVKAELLINKIPYLFSLDNNAKNDYDDFTTLYMLKKELMKKGISYNMMDEQQQEKLIKIVKKPSLSFSEMNGLNALRQVNTQPVGKIGNGKGKSPLLSYEEPILKPIENKEKDLENTEMPDKNDLLIQTLLNEVLSEEYSLNLYPNPAIEMVSIYYYVPVSETTAEIEITNSTGALVKTISLNVKDNSLTLNTTTLKKGIYFVSLVCNNRKTNVKKLVVQ
jgi:hypothetical protein